MKKEYIELFCEKYLKCTSCKYGKDGHCSLFDCSYGNSDGCKEKTIKNAEANKESA